MVMEDQDECVWAVLPALVCTCCHSGQRTQSVIRLRGGSRVCVRAWVWVMLERAHEPARAGCLPYPTPCLSSGW